MPVALFVCPHCEKHAEVQVTSVTRSRPCPHCGENVVLQVAGKQKGKRRALLVATGSAPTMPDDVIAQGIGTPAYEPQSLEGDVLERMRFDPEVIAFRRRLYYGLGALAAMIVITVIWHSVGGTVIDSVAAIGAKPSYVDPEPARRANETARLPGNIVGMKQVIDENAAMVGNTSPAGDLDFKVPGGGTLPKAETLPASSDNGGKVLVAATDPRVQAAAALQLFLKASDLEAILSTVANRPAIEPEIRRYAERYPIAPVEFDSLTISNNAGPDGERTITVNMLDGTKRDALVLLEGNRIVVDWPSFVAWSEMEWNQFIEQRPGKPTLFRVIAEAADRYDASFADRDSYVCLKLSNPSDPKAPPLFAYVNRRSDLGEEVAFVMRQHEGKPAKLTLQLRYPQDAQEKDQVLVEDLLASGWVVRKAAQGKGRSVSSL